MRLKAAGAALLALLALVPVAGAATAQRSSERDWIRVSYRELLDPEALTHSGVKLGEALRRKASRGEVQPFLDPYTSLLGFAVQMLAGPDAVPLTSLADRYPAGAAQPAWAAILREGRYSVSTDGQGRARVFTPGDDPRAAYLRAYSLLRHPLAAALTPGGPLQVDVYCYRNDFAAAELRFNPVPYRFRARSFPPHGRPLDLGELDAFFRNGGQLEGAELMPDAGLVLIASKAAQQRLGGELVSLADLAVAYRAVAYAGDAEAFVSLDRNADPTQATVNFGGLLEDTRIGKAVLAADMRFKTICSGLDPVTREDIRENTRRVVPSFMSNAERQFLANPTADLGQWITARYWYYPDSCGVETDENDRLAAITSAQLTADVERVSLDPGSAKKKVPGLPTAYRDNIREINRNYDRYAAVFPEYRDLSSAARLMALAAWMGRVRPEWLDLDGLLAATLPAESTPRVVPQLLSAATLQFSGRTPDRDAVLHASRARNLTPELDKRVAEYFGDAHHLAEFLASKAGVKPERVGEFRAAAEQLFPTVRDKRVRELLRTTEDMHAFLRSCAARIIGEMRGAQSGESARDRARLEKLLAELAALPSGSAAGGADDPKRARLEQEMGELMRKYHTQGLRASPTIVITTQYTGGVSLSPQRFSIKKSAARPALERLKSASRSVGTRWDAAGWIRSRESAAASEDVSRAMGAPRVSRALPGPARSTRPAAQSHKPPPASADAREELAPSLPTTARAMSSIAVPGSATPAGAPLVGRLAEGRRIVFTRTAR